MKDLLLKNKYFYLTASLLIIIGGIILIVSSRDNISLWINIRWTPFLDKIVLYNNNIGTAVFTILTVIVMGLWKGWRIALKAAVCFISVMLVTQFAKHILFPGTLRPTLYFEDGILRLIEGVKQLTTESFPSGHTSAAFSLATFFALYLSKKRWHWIFALIAFFVGYGRIYLSQHFFTDVYAGMIIGVVVTTLVFYFYPKSWDKHASKS